MYLNHSEYKHAMYSAGYIKQVKLVYCLNNIIYQVLEDLWLLIVMNL